MATKVTLHIKPADSKPVIYTNTGSAIPARTLVLLAAGIIGVAASDIGASTATDGSLTRVLHTAGVYKIDKATHATTKAFVAGESVWWDQANNRVDKAGTADAVYLGTCYQSAGSTDTYLYVELNNRPPINFASITVSSGQAAANSNNGQVDIVTGLGVAPTWISNPTVIDVSTGVLNTGYVMDLTTAAGTITIKGVNAGIQLDAGDILKIAWSA